MTRKVLVTNMQKNIMKMRKEREMKLKDLTNGNTKAKSMVPRLTVWSKTAKKMKK